MGGFLGLSTLYFHGIIVAGVYPEERRTRFKGIPLGNSTDRLFISKKIIFYGFNFL